MNEDFIKNAAYAFNRLVHATAILLKFLYKATIKSWELTSKVAVEANDYTTESRKNYERATGGQKKLTPRMMDIVQEPEILYNRI